MALKNQHKSSNPARFFQSHDETLIDPYREQNVFSKVGSVMKTLEHSLLSKAFDQELKKDGSSLVEELNAETVHSKPDKQGHEKDLPYAVVTEVSVSDFGHIARRPKYQLIANVIWLIDFTLRKSEERRPSLFLGDRTNVESTM